MDLISWVTVFGCLLLAICSVRLFIQSIVEVERRLNQTNMLRQQASIRYRYRNRNTIFPEPSNNNQEEIMEGRNRYCYSCPPKYNNNITGY